MEARGWRRAVRQTPCPIRLLGPHRRRWLQLALCAGLVVELGCASLRRWLVPPRVEPETTAAGYSKERSTATAELILVVAALPGPVTTETALAVRDGRIIARGTLQDLEPLRDDGTRFVRIPGGVATSGLVAAHVLLEPAAMVSDAVDLHGCRTIADVVAQLASARQFVLADSGWLWGDQLDPQLLERLSSVDLDRAVGHIAVLVTAANKPRAVANGALLGRLGELGTAIAARGGKLDERALRLAWQQLQPARPERLKPLLFALLAELQRQGVTEVEAFGATQAAWTALLLLDREGRLGLRTQLYLDAERPEGQALLAPPPVATATAPPPSGLPPPQLGRSKRSPMVRVAGVSVQLDGPLLAGAAALTQPYADLPHAGTLTYSDDRLGALVAAADRAGVAVAVAASGDAAVAQVARVLAQLRRPADAPPVRVELPQVVSPSTLDGLKSAGVQCVIAPLLTARELEVARRHVGPARVTWLDRAATLATACPLQVHLDIRHPEASLTHDRLTRRGERDPEALTAPLAWRALSAGGSGREAAALQVGDAADLVVWARDPLAPGRLPAKVVASMVGGTITLLIGKEGERPGAP